MARKSLGTLTLDLIAKVSGFEQGMDKASRKSEKTAKKIQRYSNQIGAAITAASATAVAGMTALVASTSESAREVQNLSRLAGSTPQEFQKLTYAAKRYGIEQEKVSDILKDTNDRIGDFIQTGGGPMADFFENIAPKVGVTADQFARLSGPDALQLYVRSLEEAGVSQKDMTFYMEAIASDATALVPLLRNNGREMKNLGDEAERTGNVFSDLEFEQLEDIRRGFDELSGAATGMKNEIVLAALPAVNELIDLLSDDSTLKSAQALGTAVVTAMNKAAKAVDGAIKITQFLAEELAAMTAGAAADDIVRLEDELETLYSMLDNPANRVRFFGKDGVVAYYDKDEIWDMIAETETKIVDFRRRMERGSRKAPLIDLVSPPELPGASDGRGNNTPGNTSNTITSVDNSNGDSVAGLDSPEDIEKQMADRREALLSSLQTEKQAILAAFGERDEEISKLRENQTLTEMEANNLRIQNERQMYDSLDAMRQKDIDREKEAVQARLSAAADIVSITSNQVNQMESLYGEMGAVGEAFYVMSQGLAAANAVIDGIQAAMAIRVAYAQMAAMSGPAAPGILAAGEVHANVAQAMGVAAAAGITAQTIASFEGGGYTGAGPRSGGLDGKGGFMAMLHPDESVTDHKLQKAAGGGSGTVVNVIEDNSRAGETETKRGSNGQEEVNVFVADIMGGGPRAKAMQTAFGLKRQGY